LNSETDFTQTGALASIRKIGSKEIRVYGPRGLIEARKNFPKKPTLVSPILRCE